jgi:hypothetical protein
VKKVLTSLPSRFNPNIFSIEEINDLDNLTMDMLRGILTAYEMNIEKDNPSNSSIKEESFKESKKIKIKEYKTNDDLDNEIDVEEANFVIKLKRGMNNCKCKLPFKLFNYG